MPNDAAVAAPSAAASETFVVPTDATQYAEWRQSGTLPTKKEAPAASEAEPTKTDETATSKESSEAKPKPKTAPDPESGNQEHKRGKLSAKERADQLEAENNVEEERLRQQLKRRSDLRKQAAGETPDDKKTAETSTAKPVVKEAPKGLEAPVKPKWDDFKDKENGYELYETAKDEYHEKQADYKVAKALGDERARQTMEKEVSAFMKKVDDAKQRYSDFDGKKIDEAAGQITTDQAIPQFVKQMFSDSTVMIDVLYVLSGDTEKFQNFLELARKTPTKAVREFAVTENLVMEELAGKAAKKTAEKQEPTRDATGKFQKVDDEEEESPRQVPEKKITAAPPPADEVGGRGSKPPDEVESAAKRNDFKAFQAAANRRDQASRRG